MMTVKPVRELWDDYLFVSREIAKFALQNDLEMVNTLMEQRERLQQLIDEQGDQAFRESPEGKKLLVQIQSENSATSRQLQRLLNNGKQQQTVEQAYSLTAQMAGGRLNRQG